MDTTGTPNPADGSEGWSRAGVHPDDITAPQPPVTGVHHHRSGSHPHEGVAGADVSPPGHHVTPPSGAPRRRGVLAVVAGVVGVLVLGTAGAFALSRAGQDPAAAAPSSASPPAGVALSPGAAPAADATSTDTPPPLAPSQDTLVLGDSLGLIVYPWLADLLPDRYVSYQAEVGRATPATLRKLQSVGAVPPVVIVSSGTNDPVANVFEEAARKTLDELGPARCVVWVDVVRPDAVGDSQTAMNAALDRAVQGRSNVRVLRWSALVAEHPEWMSGDGIHPDGAGSQARAQAFAEAAQGCSALDPTAPRAKRQYLPQSIFWGPVSGQYRRPAPSSTKSTASSRTPSSTPSPTTTSSSPTPTPMPTVTKTEPPSIPPSDPPVPSTSTDPPTATQSTAAEVSPSPA